MTWDFIPIFHWYTFILIIIIASFYLFRSLYLLITIFGHLFPPRIAWIWNSYHFYPCKYCSLVLIFKFNFKTHWFFFSKYLPVQDLFDKYPVFQIFIFRMLSFFRQHFDNLKDPKISFLTQLVSDFCSLKIQLRLSFLPLQMWLFSLMINIDI